MRRGLTVSGQRKRDKTKWFFLPWPPRPPPPPPPAAAAAAPPSLSQPQTGRVTGLQCKPLFTLAVILQVIKTTWSSPTISPLNARCVMTSWLPLTPNTHTYAITYTYPPSQPRPGRYLHARRGHLNIIFLKIVHFSALNWSRFFFSRFRSESLMHTSWFHVSHLSFLWAASSEFGCVFMGFF